MRSSNVNNYLTTPDYWQTIQGDLDIELKNLYILEWLNEKISFIKKGTVFEVGCYPGKYLYPFAQAGFKVSGIDYLSNTAYLKDYYAKKGYSVGDFYVDDFFNLSTNDTFDVVTSFGFIEHFKNYKFVIERKTRLVKKGGYMIIEVPNFLGLFQLLPRLLFDFKNFRMHNLNAMKPLKWAEVLKSNGFEILKTDYIGSYSVWYETKPKNILIKKARGFLTSFLFQFIKFFFKKNKSFYSPYIIMIARKVR